MGKSISKFKVPSVHRNPLALVARMRRSERFHDKRANRGGSINKQAEYLDLAEEWDDYEDVG